ncbi:hypothetical protein F7725_006846 [Dissostichus mawsoni]|uniref:Claudin n=1 Tax=Dissostichus mawsoni TaxID=36200 RepID=A0A7J5XV24_DISMA|nr:hypothetical protein F7725_006846 [Dissostichus mawsoni]
MASLGLQIVGVALAVLGWIGNILTVCCPCGRCQLSLGTTLCGSDLWEGLWMTCVVQSTGQMQCKVYDSLLALPQDLQAARAMVVIAILFSLFGLLLSVVGGKCTTCVGDKDFYNPMVPDSLRRELGACLYVGWAASGLLLCPAGGGDRYNGAKYSAPKSTTPGKEFV